MTTATKEKKPTIEPKIEKDQATQTQEWMTEYRRLLRKRDSNDADRFGKLASLLGRDVLADQSVINEAAELEPHVDAIRQLAEKTSNAEAEMAQAAEAKELATNRWNDCGEKYFDLKRALGRCRQDRIRLSKITAEHPELFD